MIRKMFNFSKINQSRESQGDARDVKFAQKNSTSNNA